jgi:hypothetical protein
MVIRHLQPPSTSRPRETYKQGQRLLPGQQLPTLQTQALFDEKTVEHMAEAAERVAAEVERLVAESESQRWLRHFSRS